MKRSLLAVAIPLVGAFVVPRAGANFVNGVETFAGNSFDTSTWQTRFFSVVSQNNGLTFTGGHIVTTSPLVPVGGGARVQFVMSQIPTVVNNFPGEADLYLTNNSAGPTTGAWDDSFSAELSFGLWPGNLHPGYVTGAVNHSGLQMATIDDSLSFLNRTWSMEIDRPTAQQYTFSVFYAGGGLLGYTTLPATAFPGPLYIDVDTDAATTVTISKVTLLPEPSALCLLALGCLGWRRKESH
jgi:hypothetical protein